MMACTTRYTVVDLTKCLKGWLYGTLLTFVVVSPAVASSNKPWPQVPVPNHVDRFQVGDQMTVNGTEMKVDGFVAPDSPAAMAASMRQLMGIPLVEDRRGDTLVLGRAQGQYYITVQLAPFGSGTRALIAVTKPLINGQNPGSLFADQRMLAALPPGSTLANRASSVDGNAHSDQAAIVNSHSIDINTEYVKRMLHAEGFILEREDRPVASSHPKMRNVSTARTMFFKRSGSEATAIVTRDESGNSVIVLNRVSFLGQAK